MGCKKRCSCGAKTGAAGSRVDLHRTARATKNPGKNGAFATSRDWLRNGAIWSSTPGGIRTPNLRFRRPLLYPVELRARMSKSMTKSIRSPRSRKRKSKAEPLRRNAYGKVVHPLSREDSHRCEQQHNESKGFGFVWKERRAKGMKWWAWRQVCRDFLGRV
jgi:hypothetical protein